MKSVFMQKSTTPTKEDLKKALGDTFDLWTTLAEFTTNVFPDAFEEWKYSSEKYGWSFRICDKKRVLIYFLPRNGFFKVAFVFGKKGVDEIVNSTLSEGIVSEIKLAKTYAEGRGIRIEVKDQSITNDIKKLIAIKIKN